MSKLVIMVKLKVNKCSNTNSPFKWPNIAKGFWRKSRYKKLTTNRVKTMFLCTIMTEMCSRL
jgi:hypothetical protein